MPPARVSLLLLLLALSACRREPPTHDGALDGSASTSLELRTEHYIAGGESHDAVAYVPDGSGAKPAVLLFDPQGHAEAAVTRWAPAAKEARWIVASTSRVANGTPDESDAQEMLGLLQALEVDFEVDRSRVFTAGTSGGGCGAYLLAILHPAEFRGGFIQTSHPASWRNNALADRVTRRDQRFYLFTRNEDFNRQGTYALNDAMRAAGLEVTLVEHGGGHEGMYGVRKSADREQRDRGIVNAQIGAS